VLSASREGSLGPPNDSIERGGSGSTKRGTGSREGTVIRVSVSKLPNPFFLLRDAITEYYDRKTQEKLDWNI